MREDWEEKKLGEISDINYGYTEKTSFDEVGPKFLRITDIQENGVNWETVPYCKCDDIQLPKYQLEKGDIVFARTGATTGKSYLIETPPLSVFASYLIRLQISNKNLLLPKYVSLFFQTQNYWDKINEGISGSAQGGFNATKLKALTILIPPIEEQKRIVAILDEAFEHLDTATRNAEKNLANAKELFESYLQSVFANPNDDWEEKSLGEVLQKTETINPVKEPEKDFIYVDVSSVNKENLRIENTSLIKGKDAPSRARKLIKTNDVIFATVRPTLKRIALIPQKFDNQVCSTGYFVLRGKEFLENKFIFYFLQTAAFIKEMETLQKGASYPAVTDKNVKEQIIKFPKSIEKQKQIVSKLDALSAECKRLEEIYQRKLENLEELRKSILQKAFDGEL